MFEALTNEELSELQRRVRGAGRACFRAGDFALDHGLHAETRKFDAVWRDLTALDKDLFDQVIANLKQALKH